MKEVTSRFARDNWSQLMDDARLEPIMITSHGRTRVVIATAMIADAVVAAYRENPGLLSPALTREEIRAEADRAARAPHQPWMDMTVTYRERKARLEEKKREIRPRFDTWTAEDEAILRIDPSLLPLDPDPDHPDDGSAFWSALQRPD